MALGADICLSQILDMAESGNCSHFPLLGQNGSKERKGGEKSALEARQGQLWEGVCIPRCNEDALKGF